MKKIVLLFFAWCMAGAALAQTQTGKASFYADKFEGAPQQVEKSINTLNLRLRIKPCRLAPK
ncbi:MAG: hypothetical protein UZ12_BCD005002378 [Bacteroidetes bacterium OLB12]|nr:MAG: hypothetical protein UZ12_BCD005002378 [Bacteroidetes bacterium OLB12]